MADDEKDTWLNLTEVNDFQDNDDTFHKIVEALINDDEDLVSYILESMSPDERVQLFREKRSLKIDTWLNVDKIPEDSEGSTRDYVEIEGNLLHVLAARAAVKVFSAALDYGSCVSLTETLSDGSNIYHLLCWAAFGKNDDEKNCEFIFKTIEKALTVKERKDLLLAEDADGFRPLELSAKLGTFVLFMAFAHSEALYKITTAKYGAWKTVVHDMSEYEKPAPKGRREKSPLKFFTYVLRSDVNSPGFYEVFRSPFIKQWINKTFSQIKYAFLFWIFLRVTFTFALLFWVGNINGRWTKVNGKRECTLNGPAYDAFFDLFLSGNHHPYLGVFIALFSYMELCQVPFMLFDLIDFWHYVLKRRKRNIKLYRRPGKKQKSSYLIGTAMYRAFQFIYVYMAAIQGPIVMLQSFKFLQNYQFGNTYIALTMPLFATWPLMYFLQALPGVGHLVVAFQRSVETYTSFSLLFALMFAAFSSAFYLLLQFSCTYVDGTLFEAFYFTFQILLNQIDITSFTTSFFGEWYTVHFIFINVSSILLLNFCIAILTQSFSDITQYDDVIQKLQYLNVAITLQDRMGPLLRPVRRWLKRGGNDGRIQYSTTCR